MRRRLIAARSAPGGEATTERAALCFGRRLAAYKSCLAGAMLTNDMQEGAQFSVPPPVSRKKSACVSPSRAAAASAAASDSNRASNASISSGLISLSFLSHDRSIDHLHGLAIAAIKQFAGRS